MNYIDVCNQLNIEMNIDSIGTSGEDIAKTIFGYLSIFRVVFLGERCPIVDFYVEIANDKECPYSFLVQVKTTTSELDERGRLLVEVPYEKYKALCHRPIPTYLGGVNLNNHTLFVRPAFCETEHVSFIEPKMVLGLHDILDCGSKLLTIKRDVINYWENLKAGEYKKAYRSII